MADMTVEQFKAIEAFVKEVLVEVYRVNVETEVTKVDKEKLAEMLNAEAFKAFLVRYCEEKGCGGVTCPI